MVEYFWTQLEQVKNDPFERDAFSEKEQRPISCDHNSNNLNLMAPSTNNL
jgi:hypothetical protein